MKKLLTLALILVPLLSMAQDDLYFTPSKKAKEAAQKRNAASMTARTETVTAPTVVDYHSNTRSEDEYNRRYVNGEQYVVDSLDASVNTVDEGVAPRYDLSDPELDYRYSRRIVRFHSPRLYALTSPYYWDLYYGYGAWDYLYDPWDPWYWHYGWSYGWSWGPWDCWYGSIWGWNHPYSWSYWGWGPGWSRPVYYTSYYRNTVPREFNSSRGHMAAGNRIRTNAGGGRTMTSRTNVNTVTSRANAAGGRTQVGGSRTQIYNGAIREGNGRRSTVGAANNNFPTRSANNQASSSRTMPQQQGRTQVQPQTRTQVQPQTRTQVQQPTRTQPQQQQQTRTQPQTRTQVQQPTRTYTPAPATRSSGSIGGGGFGGATRSGGGSFGGGGSRGGGGRR